ncbi:RDD family protein [Thermaerobacter sp. FW80]|uniref:RDD family protein n=1 Tax=Thermaerobacter sp. FW80 TaxID=2546351 RepID=UPI0010756A77|nr:RDD family protein [Thermaerobacter sp. FW80]
MQRRLPIGACGTMASCNVATVFTVVIFRLADQFSAPSHSWLGTVDIMVTDVNGRWVSFARATGRFMAEFVFMALTFGLGYRLSAFTRRRQALHDLIAETLVIRRPAQRGAGPGGRRTL